MDCVHACVHVCVCVCVCVCVHVCACMRMYMCMLLRDKTYVVYHVFIVNLTLTYSRRNMTVTSTYYT